MSHPVDKWIHRENTRGHEGFARAAPLGWSVVFLNAPLRSSLVSYQSERAALRSRDFVDVKKNFLRNNGLSFVLMGLFGVFWIAQAFVGRLEYNEERAERKLPPLPVMEYLGSSHFWRPRVKTGKANSFNMTAYVLLTIFLFQKGSSESKDPDKPSPQDKDPRTGTQQAGCALARAEGRLDPHAV
jgi:hypothetical protein